MEGSHDPKFSFLDTITLSSRSVYVIVNWREEEGKEEEEEESGGGGGGGGKSDGFSPGFSPLRVSPISYRPNDDDCVPSPGLLFYL